MFFTGRTETGFPEYVTSDEMNIDEMEYINCVLIYHSDLHQVTRVIRSQTRDEDSLWRVENLSARGRNRYEELGRAEVKTLIDATRASTPLVNTRVSREFRHTPHFGTIRGFDEETCRYVSI